MLKRKMNRKKGQQGFTLLEILVVVAIMGFLVAMVAPRFAGIVGGTEDVVCDTNQQRLVAALATYYETKGALPSGLVNLVDEDGTEGEFTADRYLMPTDESHLEFPDEGQATFFEEFVERNQFQMHILTAEEAAELRSLGVGSVFNLNAYNYDGTIGTHADAYATTEPVAEADRLSAYRRSAVQTGLGVLMIALGHDGTAWQGPANVNTSGGANTVLGDELGNPEWIGRIILGVGPESALVRDGMITTAGICPASLDEDGPTWGNYSVVLPRLGATVARADFPAGLASVAAQADGGALRTFELNVADPGFMFLTQCPEGHRFPTPDGFESWEVALDYDGTTAIDTLF